MKKSILVVLIVLFAFGMASCIGVEDNKAVAEMDSQSDSKYMDSDVFTGLNFGSTIDRLCTRYNEHISRDADAEFRFKSYVEDEEYLNCAYTLIYSVLKAPSTAVIDEKYVYEKDSYGRAVVIISVDAQNSFGAYLRQNFCVVIQGVRRDGSFDYGKAYIDTFTDQNSKQLVIDHLKKSNGFGLSRAQDRFLDEQLFKVVQNNNELKRYTQPEGYVEIFVDSQGYIFSFWILMSKDMLESLNVEGQSTVIQNLERYWYAVANNSVVPSSLNISNIFDTGKAAREKSFEDEIYFECYEHEGIVYIGITSMSEDAYNEQNLSVKNVYIFEKLFLSAGVGNDLEEGANSASDDIGVQEERVEQELLPREAAVPASQDVNESVAIDSGGVENSGSSASTSNQVSEPSPAQSVQPGTDIVTGTIYSVQLGAFQSYDTATAFQNTILSGGYEAYITNVGGWYKVHVGSFYDEQEARTQLEYLKAAGYDTAFIVKF